MTSTNKILQPPNEYDDDVLFGPRRDALRMLALIKATNNSECVVYSQNAFFDKNEQWYIGHLIGLDKRIKAMLNEMEIKGPLPTQRYLWPQIHKSKFPFVCVAPEASGKTSTYLLYIVTQCITTIPVAITDEIMTTGSELGSFSTLNPDQVSKKAQDPKTNDVPVITNHADFDFDALLNSKGITCEPENATDNPNEDKQQEPDQQTDSWGLETQEHYEVDPNTYVTHPKYIVICSSQQNVDKISIEIEHMKAAAYESKMTSARLKNLPPIARALNVHQEEDKLALKCNESEILVVTPGSLVKCLEHGFIDFSKCKKVFFDDADQTLQVHNSTVRNIIKRFIIDSQLKPESNNEATDGRTNDECQMYLFSRKWTDLMKEFVNAVFPQRNLIFSSIAEAALYSNVCFELEYCKSGGEKFSKLIDLLNICQKTSKSNKVAIICKTDGDAKNLETKLKELNYFVKHLPEDCAVQTYQANWKHENYIYILSDYALEFVVEHFNNVNHLIQVSLPNNSLIFDQRFRLMYRDIQDNKRGLLTTIFTDHRSNPRQMKELLDIISRSSTTPRSTKLELRDYLSDISETICWRWASTGVCRLNKLSKDDRFGSFCPDKHSLIKSKGYDTRWPNTGQVKMIITHLISPSEFYFWFIACRDINSTEKRWKTFETSGPDFMSDLQTKLDKLKDTKIQTVSIKQLSIKKVYGVYLHQETRVDRVMLIEEPDSKEVGGAKKGGMMARLSADYFKQFEFTRIDYGSRINLYLRNIFELPDELVNIPPQCHRAFHIGYQPTDNEPNWLYKAKKHFYDTISVKNLYEITAWLRMNQGGCFWFENMTVIRLLPSLDEHKLFKSEPHRELCKMQLAVPTSNCPSCLPPSDRLETLSKWQVDESLPFAQYAFLKHKDEVCHVQIFLLQIDSNIQLSVRRFEFNKQLIRLEDELLEDYKSGKLSPLRYFEEGIYCIAQIPEGHDTSGNTVFTFNRCKLKTITSNIVDNESPLDEDGSMYTVECLDHGDIYKVKRSQLYLAKPEHLSILPFQAIKHGLADFNKQLLEDRPTIDKIVDILYDLSRDSEGDLVPLQCKLEPDGGLYLYFPIGADTYRPLVFIIERQHNIRICNNNDASLREDLKIEAPKEEVTMEKLLEMPLSSASCEMFANMLKTEVEKDGGDRLEDYSLVLQELENIRSTLD